MTVTSSDCREMRIAVASCNMQHASMEQDDDLAPDDWNLLQFIEIYWCPGRLSSVDYLEHVM